MSSPPQNGDLPQSTSPVPIPSRSDSPIRRRTDSPVRLRTESPIHRRRSTSTVHNDTAIDLSASSSTSRPRLSPTLTRSFNPNDPDARERQRTLDVDMAMHMARARSQTVSSPTTAPAATGVGPVVSPFHHVQPDPSPMQMPLPLHPPSRELPSFTAAHMDIPGFSEQEEREFDAARQGGALSAAPSDIDGLHLEDPHTMPPSAVPMQMPESEPFLPMYQQHVSYATQQPSRSEFDFSHMEDYARQERDRLGLNTPVSPPGIRWSDFTQTGRRPPSKPVAPTEVPPIADGPAVPVPAEGSENEAGPSNPGPRLRQRKFSQSKPVSRRTGAGKKMAMFENQGSSGMLGGARNSFGQVTSAMASFENLPGVGGFAASSPMGFPGSGVGSGVGMGGGTGHDRPYRFSFYSNTMSGTIHSRSLAELPAEGQTFEELFTGVANVSPPSVVADDKSVQPSSVPDSIASRVLSQGGAATHSRAGSGTPNFAGRSAAPTPVPGYSRANGSSSKTAVLDVGETNTWWLDVTAPTEEEMKMLSQVFSIHPLTTEDIMMEETREKIELFRNYYLVCFRSFDQDPYSATYLDPLNMYIIVFREGILSFHSRPTPHPQNVRRRIKQLKDYISVTSDWISYALIDDITDAFGPLIQSIEYEVDSIDELVLILRDAEQTDMLKRMGTTRKKVMGLLRLMGNKADVVKGLAKRCNENWRVAPTSDIGLYLSDIQDHLITMTQNLNHYEKILSRSHSNYLAQISIEMTDANNQINDVLSKMTALGTVLIPMNLVTGLWGMNVRVPGQDAPGYTWFASILAGLCVFAALGGYITFRLMRR